MTDTTGPADEHARPRDETWTTTLTVHFSPENMTSFCSGCHRFGTLDEIAEHIKVCPEHPMALLRADLAAARASEDRLREAGDAMAACIGYFWKPSPCEHDDKQCPPCEADRWGLLYQAMERWQALAARHPDEGAGARVGGD